MLEQNTVYKKSEWQSGDKDGDDVYHRLPFTIMSGNTNKIEGLTV